MAQDIGLRGYRIQDPEKMRSRRREIMLAAADVIWEKGYAATTLEDVAARLGVTRTVIYYQFRSKEDLYTEMCLEAVKDATARLNAIVERGHRSVCHASRHHRRPRARRLRTAHPQHARSGPAAKHGRGRARPHPCRRP